MNTTNQFKVVAISKNTNSFGLRQFVMVARDGKAYKVCRQAYGTLEQWKQNQLVDVPSQDFNNPDFHTLGCELVDNLPQVPRAVIREVFAN